MLTKAYINTANTNSQFIPLNELIKWDIKGHEMNMNLGDESEVRSYYAASYIDPACMRSIKAFVQTKSTCVAQ